MHVRRYNIFAILSYEIDVCFADPFPFFNWEYRMFYFANAYKSTTIGPSDYEKHQV